MLRHGVFAVLLVASACAALMPDWATRLKAQNYAGYVDLRLQVQLSSPSRVRTVRAGSTADFLVSLANGGPDDAHRARTSALVQGNAVVTGTSGCLEDPLGYPDCTLSAPLPANGSVNSHLTLAVSPLARGQLDVAVAAASDDPEDEPGQEFVLLQVPIEAHVDLQVASVCNRGYLTPNVPLSCRVTFHNAGPAAAVTPMLYVNTFGYFSNVSCAAPRPELCTHYMPATWWPNVLLPGETITLDFDTALTPNLGVDTWQMFVGAIPKETQDVPTDNVATASLPVAIFADGFDGDPPPL